MENEHLRHMIRQAVADQARSSELLFPQMRANASISDEALEELCAQVNDMCDTAMKRAGLFMNHRQGKTLNQSDILAAWETIELDKKL